MRRADPIRQEQRRQQILEAAGRCFMRDGFRGASISDICHEAKMSPGHLYHYFESKDAIIAALTQAGLAQAAAHFDRVMNSAHPLAAFIEEVANARYGPASQLLVLDMLVESGRVPSIAAILREHSRALRGMLAKLLRQAQERGEIDSSLEPDPTAATLLAIIDGCRAMAVRDPKLARTAGQESVKLLIRRFLKAR